MHFWPSILLVLLLFLSNFGSGINATSCINDQQCTVSNISCPLCIQGNGPTCTSSICVFRRCVTIEACSLQFSGTCKKDGDCIADLLFEACSANMGPYTAKAICVNGTCAQIELCTIQLKNWSFLCHEGKETHNIGFTSFFFIIRLLLNVYRVTRWIFW
jgi:hypothetical protein